MDTVLTILGLAVLILVVVWIGRRIAAHARRTLSDADPVQLALEEARAEAVKLGWDEINVAASGERSSPASCAEPIRTLSVFSLSGARS